jgi:hypothetical protein
MTRALWVLAVGLPLTAQPKLLVNAQVKTVPAGAGLEGAFRPLLSAQPQPAWIAYSVPSVRSFQGCDYVRDGFEMPGVVHLEPPDHTLILFRVEEGAVNRIRSLSPDCEIDAGGLPFYWLGDVQGGQSVALLQTFVTDRERLGDNAAAAIAQHADPAADQVLDRFLATDQPQSLRMRSVSWMSRRGRHGFETLKRLIASDPDERIRERAVSALGSNREPEAMTLLASIVQADKNARLREQAISAMGRKAEPAFLLKVVESDPEIGVKRRAVSALHSLPDGAGVPGLIQLVKTTQNLDVRRAAMSSLGSSRDPRATAFFEEVLKK